MARKRSDQRRLPWTAEFAPGELKGSDDPLLDALQIVDTHGGDRDTLAEAIRRKWFKDSVQKRAHDPSAQLHQQLELAKNVIRGMDKYNLVDQTLNKLTPFGEELLRESDKKQRYERLAAWILDHGEGDELLDTVRFLRMKLRRNPKTTEVREELRTRNFYVRTNDNDPSKVRAWLSKADLISDDWEINEARYAEITGTTSAQIVEWQALTRQQRQWLEVLYEAAMTKGSGWIAASDLVDRMRDRGIKFDEGQLRAKIYDKVRAGGWIEHRTKIAGRNSKGGFIAATQKLLDSDVGFLAKHAKDDLPADLRAHLATPLADIDRDLKSTDKHVAGIALELLTLNLAVDLNLLPVKLRVRGVKTKGNEVDLLAEGAHLHFSRWMFQCKNTATVHLPVLTREIGVATLLHANVIVIVTTGRFAGSVKRAAPRITESTPFQVVLVDGDVLTAYRTRGPVALREVFHEGAITALQLKRPQVLEVLDEIEEDESS